MITKLTEQKREGTYWDFKEQHHSRKPDLLHDVLCLANCDHKGSRYLIFGVRDNDYAIVGLDEKRKQADFQAFFHDNSNLFAGSRVPEFLLHDLSINGKDIQVLEILDRPHKPYRLTQKYRKEGGLETSIFTRIQDRNTPRDRSAEDADVERMYRERFGLDLRPLDRLKLLLSDDKYNWGQLDFDGRYCEDAPEFTYKFSDGTEQYDLEWVRGEVGNLLPDGNWVSDVEFFYFGTKIHTLQFVSFDGGKKKAVAPTWVPYKIGRIYYYEKGSLSEAFQQRTVMDYGSDHTVGLRRSRSGGYFTIPTLDQSEADDFQKRHRSFAEIPASDRDEQNRLFYEGLEALGKQSES